MSARASERTPWTDERIDRLKAMWADGKPASAIATALGGVTRNGVIGKVYRLNLSGHAKAPPKPRASVAVGKRPPTTGNRLNHGGLAFKIAAGTLGKKPSRPAPKPTPVAIDLPAPVSRNLTVMDLSDLTCKWPVNDPPKGSPHLFCGARAEPGGPYCKHHFLRSRDRAALRARAA